MARRISLTLALAASLAPGACGSDPVERGVSGAGIGAGTGAVVGALTGGLSIVGGALIGAVVGGGASALTSKDQIDLGKLGYAAGPADGKMGDSLEKKLGHA